MGTTNLNRVSRAKLFGGWTETYEHESEACGAPMRFAVFLPPAAETGRVPALYWLSGLTCTEENFTVKAGAQRTAAELGLALVAPDTSPRGLRLPGEDDDWDLGTGAGFYVNATQAPWAGHYSMFDYVNDELPRIVEENLPVIPGRKSVSGHSMGGHGALISALKYPERYTSVSAFAPICAPSQCPWGQKAFSHYLGPNRDVWRDYDATCLVADATKRIPLLVDQGDADPFLVEQLKPELLEQACKDTEHPLTLIIREGYDHGYFYISTFIDEHLRYHAEALGS